MNIVLKIPFFLAWGSFLNVVAYRLIHTQPFSLSSLCGRSKCPHCNTIIAWYDNIPLISWIALRARCRTCKHPISPLYPLIELLTTTVFTVVTLNTAPDYHYGYYLFFSALIVTIRTDIETMMISRYVTLYAVPAAWLLSYCQLLPLSISNSILGALTGYLFLYIVSKFFTYCTGKQGIGQGDLDLLCFIGAFTGILGWWASVALGSVAGSIVGLTYIACQRPTDPVKLPFGAFLAAGALIFVLFEPTVTTILLGM